MKCWLHCNNFIISFPNNVSTNSFLFPQIRAKLEQRKQRKHSEVAAIFSIGERQKTMFEKSSNVSALHPFISGVYVVDINIDVYIIYY